MTSPHGHRSEQGFLRLEWVHRFPVSEPLIGAACSELDPEQLCRTPVQPCSLRDNLPDIQRPGSTARDQRLCSLASPRIVHRRANGQIRHNYLRNNEPDDRACRPISSQVASTRHFLPRNRRPCRDSSATTWYLTVGTG